MNLRALRYFVAIADAGSITAAADIVSVAQPALSRQLRELEAEMGVALLVRGARGVRLTPDGVAFYESAVRILSEAARVRQRLSMRPNTRLRQVTLGVSPTLAGLLLPGLMGNCLSSEMDLQLKAREGFTPELITWTEKGMADLAILTNPEPTRSLSFHLLLGEPFALVSNARLGLDPVVPLAQLPRIPVLITSLHRRLVERQITPLQGQLNVRAEIDSVDAVREMVISDSWATIMPISVFRGRYAHPDVRISQVSGVQLSRQLVLAKRVEKDEARELELVQNLVQAELDRLVRNRTFSFPV
ncbi:LysR family transcriptional regulator [Paracandidimonas soli]|uniref:LysR family nitrogen assimilation transcriptional regulator n=1 Tax=Paracandidimonas soli TaxID=1917182 RepID=A0A4R3UW83_9BURK|nr:LysR family transcriptional regulator [Paracandidimonas soli]TCU95241.1 LysR family nitrogen assimilation transcriptional regulator [Paracandidimonas soli]